MLRLTRLSGRPHAARIWATATVLCAAAGTAWGDPGTPAVNATLDHAIARELDILRTREVGQTAPPQTLPADHAGGAIRQVADEAPANQPEQKSEVLQALEEMYRRSGQEMPPMQLEDAPHTRLKNGKKVVLPDANGSAAQPNQTTAKPASSAASSGGAKPSAPPVPFAGNTHSSAAPQRLPSSAAAPLANRATQSKPAQQAKPVQQNKPVLSAAVTGEQPPVPPLTRTSGSRSVPLPPPPTPQQYAPEPQKPRSFFGRLFGRKPESSNTYTPPTPPAPTYDPAGSQMAAAANPVSGSRTSVRGPSGFFNRLFKRDSAESQESSLPTGPQEDLPEVRTNLQFAQPRQSPSRSSTGARIISPPPVPAPSPSAPAMANTPSRLQPQTTAPRQATAPAPLPPAPVASAKPAASAPALPAPAAEPTRVATAPSSSTPDFRKPIDNSDPFATPAPTSTETTPDTFPPGTFAPVVTAPPAPAPEGEESVASAADPFGEIRGMDSVAEGRFPGLKPAPKGLAKTEPHPLEATNISSAAPTHLDPDAVAQAQPADPIARDTANRYTLLKQKLAERAHLDGFQGFCPVALRDHRELIDAKQEFVCVYDGDTYTVSSAEAKARFDSEPTKYAPVAHGNDVILQARNESETAGNLNYAAWYKDRLYLFRTAETMKEFQSDPVKYAVTR